MTSFLPPMPSTQGNDIQLCWMNEEWEKESGHKKGGQRTAWKMSRQ